MPRSPTLNLAIYPSIPRRVSSASITNPSAATRLSVTGHVYVTRPITYLQLIYMRYPGWPNFHVRRADSYKQMSRTCIKEVRNQIRAQIWIVTPDIRISKRNRGVETAEIRSLQASALAISRRGAASIVEGTVMLARGRVGDDYTTGCGGDRAGQYFAPPNALLPEGSLQRHGHVGLHPFVVLDTVLVHDLRFCHKARNQKYQH
ncbi:hypothetical protein ALC60_07870 [Trachymyrmex zeteki]|uniref:Uncharacterized protein n=1 Tax=Mycetomoellerius zeteki TaxID=64791 RepID=A0A151WZ21_9HYME|nr:hypothetical protein ALC60_07870 [Trachymyrmex zeteki]